MSTKEQIRLDTPYTGTTHPWRKWGPYVAERAWGTVREDYSSDGNAWTYCSHDMARSKAYRWGEDGIAGFCDIYQICVFSLALWNEQDSILKERLFGLNPFEGNHGEDVKEYYFYLDGTPTHSYMKYLYKYPQAAFPYEKLLEENKKRGTQDREYELVDTGVFQENRYFDVFIEYAKVAPEDIYIRIEAHNRGPEAAPLHIVPQLFFRNRWSWISNESPAAAITEIPTDNEIFCLFVDPMHLTDLEREPYEYHLSPFYFYGKKPGETLFTNNETNNEHLYQTASRTPYVKDAFHRHIINKEKCTIPEKKGTKAAIHYQKSIAPGESQVFYFRICQDKLQDPFIDVERVFSLCKQEADAFYQAIHPASLTEEDKSIQRQAYAGMLWSKQFYRYNVAEWLQGDDPLPKPPLSRNAIRNYRWQHVDANAVISMPDKWEYPWFAAWDLSFHAIALAGVDKEYAKEQLCLLLSHTYQHPNGQIPAYEWGFSDLNPPVQAFAAWRIYCIDEKKDKKFLSICFLKLISNYDWWVNKVDKEGNNLFEGGFLGLDNISIIDRSKPLRNGGCFEESDGSGWMAFFSLSMMKIALELSDENHYLLEIAITFFEHFVSIANALHIAKSRGVGMWNEQDGFLYDIVSYPDGTQRQLQIRSFVGIIPFCSIEYFEEEKIKKHPKFYNAFLHYIKKNDDVCKNFIRVMKKEEKTYYVLSLLTEQHLCRTMEKMFDPNEFYSSYGLRSLSKYHEKNPFYLEGSFVGYEPGESLERIKGGNSNWRGPIWIPTNFLVLEALIKLHKVHGDMHVSKNIALATLINELRNRLVNLFRCAEDHKRPIHGEFSLFQTDPYWKEYLLFYEHYHGDTGRGLGASHQTGWSGLIATLLAEME